MKTVSTLLIGFALGLLALSNVIGRDGQLGALVVLAMGLVLYLVERQADKRSGIVPAGWKITHTPHGTVVVDPQGTACLVSLHEDTSTGRQLYRLASAMRANAELLDDYP